MKKLIVLVAVFAMLLVSVALGNTGTAGTGGRCNGDTFDCEWNIQSCPGGGSCYWVASCTYGAAWNVVSCRAQGNACIMDGCCSCYVPVLTARMADLPLIPVKVLRQVTSIDPIIAVAISEWNKVAPGSRDANMIVAIPAYNFSQQDAETLVIPDYNSRWSVRVKQGILASSPVPTTIKNGKVQPITASTQFQYDGNSLTASHEGNKVTIGYEQNANGVWKVKLL